MAQWKPGAKKSTKRRSSDAAHPEPQDDDDDYFPGKKLRVGKEAEEFAEGLESSFLTGPGS